MVEILDWENTVTEPRLRTGLPTAASFLPNQGTQENPEAGSFGKSLIAGAVLNNSVASGLRDVYGLWSAGEKPEEFDASFNPRTHLRETLSKEDLEALDPAIKAGVFDAAVGPRATARAAANSLAEKRLLEQEGGSWLGATVGALVGSVADPLTYFAPEAKWWQTGSTAIRLGKSVLHAAATMAPQEAVLWQEQDWRDWQQSLLNVGTGSVLGGGIGFFGRSYMAGHALNPDNLKNPLREENLGKGGLVSIVPGEGADIIPHISAGEPYSVGAAASPHEAPSVLGGTSKVGDLFFGFSPSGRALRWLSPEARSMMTKLVDTGGVYTNLDREGVALGPSVEDITTDTISRWHKELGLMNEEAIHNQTQEQLSQAGARRLDPADLNYAGGRTLDGSMTPQLKAQLVGKYGQAGADVILNNAQQIAAGRQIINASQEAAMRKAGILRDDAVVAKLKNNIQALRDQRNAALEAHDKETASTVETKQAAITTAQKGGAEPLAINQMQRDLREHRVARKVARDEVAEQFDEKPLQAALNHERSKVQGLGADYGVQQRWEPGQISRNREEVSNFLLQKFSEQPADHWLLDAYGLTSKEYEDLKVSDPAKHLEILREWAGEEHDVKVKQAENSWKAAKEREHLAKLDLNDTLHTLGVHQTAERQAEVSERGRYRDMFNAKIAAEREVQANLRREEQSIVEAATAARQQTLDRALQHTPVGPDVGAAELEALGRREGTEAKFFQGGAKGAERDVHGVSKVVRTTEFNQERAAELGQKSAAARTAAYETPLMAPAAPEASETAALARQAERAQQIQKQLAESDARLQDLLQKQIATERAFMDARDARVTRKGARQAMQQVATDVRRMRELSARNVPQAKRAMRSAKAGTPLADEVQNIVAQLSANGRLPMSALEDVVSDPGRFKARRIILTPEERVHAIEKGWLRSDYPNLYRSQDRAIAAHLAIREAFDLGPGRTFESWKDVEDHITRSYEQLIGDKTGRERGKLENNRNDALKDLNGLKARALGQVDAGGDRESWFPWASRKMRQYNFIRYAATMLIPSIADMGSFALQHRIAPMLAAHGAEATGMALKGLTPKYNTELRRMISMAETATHGSMMAERMDDANAFRPHGIGAQGSLKNTITGGIDKYGEAVSNFAGKISGLPQWDRFWKILSGLQMMHDIRDQVGRGFDSLTAQEQTHLTGLGIGRREAGMIQKMIEAHGETDATSGLFDPRLENWHGTEEGAEAARRYRVAVMRDMNRSRFWPGMGDRPLFADKWYGGLFTQFQNFAFAFTNRYIAQFAQRAVHFQDIRTAASFGALMASGAVVMQLKDLTRGINPADRWSPQNTGDYMTLGHELIDRSFLMGYLSPYVDALWGLTGLPGVTKYERESWPEKLAGVNVGLIGDTQRFATQLAGTIRGDKPYDRKTIDKLTAIAPFASLLRLGAHAYDSVEGKPARNPYQQ